MYYKKYFSGSLDATSTSNEYYMGKDKVATETVKRSWHIKNRSDVIGNAIVSTLYDVGYTNAYWDSTAGYLFLDKTNSLCGFYISVLSSATYISRGVNSASYDYLINGHTTESSGDTSGSYASYISISNSTSNYPFSTTGATACEYKFYVTIIGEPTGMMRINVGSYSNTSSGAIQLYVGKGVDKRDNSELYILTMLSSTSTYDTIYTTLAASKLNAETVMVNQSIALSSKTLTLVDETIVLIPVFFYIGYVVMNNTYFNPGLSVGFYEIDGSVYYATTYYMTKCVTEI